MKEDLKWIKKIKGDKSYEVVVDNDNVSVIKEGVCVYTFSESGDRLIPILFNALGIKADFC